MSATIILVGCGKMGGAMLHGWLAQGTDPAVEYVVDPFDAKDIGLGVYPGLTFHRDASTLPAGLAPDAVVFAVKPQEMDTAAPAYRRFTTGGAVALSIAAGRTMASIAAHLGTGTALVRAMPNTPAAVGRGVTVACPSAAVSPDQRALCDGLLAAVGTVAWITDETLMDVVTAVSGSGPAYVFLLVECLAAAGIAAGLPQDLAVQLARETVAGSGELVRQSDDSAATLRQNVTSPGGTTEAALRVLMAKGAMAPLLEAAVRAAADRSRALAG